ncbi:MAG TPA: winged helix DNA-binding domain-containing protein [Thermoanaerobaculia bacterium]|nr:winged helix DNA-binding domain-containing protein [Thermoanaerobaculia bacterium]
MPPAAQRLTLPALNRALLARQGLLDRLEIPPTQIAEAVEAIGALQAQYWPALPVALWSRVQGFAAEDLYSALERRELVLGILLRGTLHLVSAREHPDYSQVVEESGANDWRRTAAELSPESARLRAEFLAYTASPRSREELAAFIEAWIADHPGAIDEAEVAAQRSFQWRPFYRWSAPVRTPADGRWGAKTPEALLAAPRPPAPNPEAALAAVLRRHLRAFGPAAAEDVAGWIGLGTPRVRAALERLGPELVRFEDEDRRTLYDLPAAPRPDPQVPAPARFLPSFDSTLLAYAAKGRARARLVPAVCREPIYARGNLRILPTFLVDGKVAGTWAVAVRRREATLTLTPCVPLARAARTAVVEEGERLLRFSEPRALAHRVVFET